jgi:Ca-activated chloride channel family protein
MGRRCNILIFVVCFVPLAWVCAEDTRIVIEPRPARPARGNADRIAPHIRVDSNLVLVPVTVTDRDERLVTGLIREDFKLFEDRIERPITQFAIEDAPVSIVLLFDCSGSMHRKQEQARAAVIEFLKNGNQSDEFALIEFNDRARLVVPFTVNPDHIAQRMLSSEIKGQTALLDAICLALNAVRYGRHKRKALFIVSDGGDNHSRYNSSEIKDRVREADVPIYSIAIVPNSQRWSASPEEIEGPRLLENFARLSGGRSIEVQDCYELPEIGAKMAQYLRNLYMLGFSPAVPLRDGKYHKIEVKLAPLQGLNSMQVRFRSGYVSPEP